MTKKITGYYSDASVAPTGNTRLVLEIGPGEIACVSVHENAPCALEWFETEGEWETIFRQLAAASDIMGRTYNEVVCYYGSEEALVIPVKKFDTVAAEDYLALVFGERYHQDVKHDVLVKKGQVTAYHIDKELHDLLGRQYVLYKPRHVYTGILDDLLTRPQLPGYLVHMQAYRNMCVLLLIREGQLQLVRSIHYTTPEDILYYLTSLIQQFPVLKSHAHLEISGRLPEGFLDMYRLRKLFMEVSYQLPSAKTESFAKILPHPPHYFASLLNLAV